MSEHIEQKLVRIEARISRYLAENEYPSGLIERDMPWLIKMLRDSQQHITEAEQRIAELETRPHPPHDLRMGDDTWDGYAGLAGDLPPGVGPAVSLPDDADFDECWQPADYRALQGGIKPGHE